ncbi:NADPH-dependent FMN reductase [Lysobacteraceae bacterium NML08-0793]|nr:NADPH-dependent FMN reductase [Xanthomonadaceae bacterium NML08-0793]
MIPIALVVGSLAAQSINRAMAEHLAAQAPAGVAVQPVQIGDLPLYTQDRDAESVPAYDRVRAQIKAARAVLIVSPEHNRGVPAALKNLIDIGSRPYGQNVWQGKKVGIVTASPGTFGGVHAGLQIRQSLQALGAEVLIAPEVFLSRAHSALVDGKLNDERTTSFLNQFAAGFYAWAAA